MRSLLRLRRLRMRRLFLVLLVLMTLLQLVTWLLETPKRSVTSAEGDILQVFPHREWSGRKKLLVLQWTRYYNDGWWSEDPHAFDHCPQPNCQVTSDKTKVADSDAVMFHAWDLWHYFLGRPLPSVRHPHQVWMLVNREPGSMQPLDLSRYNGVFNWTAWYRRDADVTLECGHVTPLTEAERRQQGKELSGKDWSAGKSKMAAWVASNCYDSARRRLVVNELSRYIPVDTYGRCGRKVACPGYQADCPELLSQYKFYLSFENSRCPNYVTEKFWRALGRDQVPITLDGINYTGVAPPGSYISLDDFGSVRELAEHLRYLDNNATAYNSYFRWREQWRVGMPDLMCLTCAALNDRRRPAQVYTDLAAWDRRVESPGCEAFSLRNVLARLKDSMLITLGVK